MEDDPYLRAKARVEEKFGFYRHATTYVLVNALLVVINLTQSPDYFWAKWPIFGWGIGLTVHAFDVFAPRWFGSKKEDMIRREMEREKRERGG